MKSLLLIEDDLALNSALKFDLEKQNFNVLTIFLGNESIEIIKNETIDMIILDVNLPDISGFELIKRLKNINKNIPVLFFSACDLDKDILKGFDLGAEDYVTKPFNIEILHKKIDVILRRNQIDENIFQYDDYIYFDIQNLELKINNKDISLTPTEYKLLIYFIKNKNQILTKENIMSYLWDINNNYVDEHTLLVNVSRLRHKIEDEKHRYIKTIYGIGYRWNSHE